MFLVQSGRLNEKFPTEVKVVRNPGLYLFTGGVPDIPLSPRTDKQELLRLIAFSILDI